MLNFHHVETVIGEAMSNEVICPIFEEGIFVVMSFKIQMEDSNSQR